MINGDVNEFLDLLSRGFEVVFTFHGKKYFAQGYSEDGLNFKLMVDQWEPEINYFIWTNVTEGDYNIKAFENAKIFEGKSFCEVQDEIVWFDC